MLHCAVCTVYVCGDVEACRNGAVSTSRDRHLGMHIWRGDSRAHYYLIEQTKIYFGISGFYSWALSSITTTASAFLHFAHIADEIFSIVPEDCLLRIKWNDEWAMPISNNQIPRTTRFLFFFVMAIVNLKFVCVAALPSTIHHNNTTCQNTRKDT